MDYTKMLSSVISSVSPETILVYVSSAPDDALGENVIRLPFLMALRALYPTAHITWMPGTGDPIYPRFFAPLIEGKIDSFINDLVLEKKWTAVFTRPACIQGRSFDLIIDLQHNIARTVQLRRIPHKRFISPTWGWMFSDGRPPKEQTWSISESRRLVALAAAAAQTIIEPIQQLELAPEWYEKACHMLPDGPVYVGLAPGAGRQDSGKLWPLQNYIDLAIRQYTKGRTPVFIIGPSETKWLDQIRTAVPNAFFPGHDAIKDINPHLTGCTLTIALASRLAVSVANCSGTGHMLGTGGSPMVSLFGPTNPGKYLPHGPHSIALESKTFSQSSDISTIPLQAVDDAVDEQISRNKSFGR